MSRAIVGKMYHGIRAEGFQKLRNRMLSISLSSIHRPFRALCLCPSDNCPLRGHIIDANRIDSVDHTERKARIKVLRTQLGLSQVQFGPRGRRNSHINFSKHSI